MVSNACWGVCAWFPGPPENAHQYVVASQNLNKADLLKNGCGCDMADGANVVIDVPGVNILPIPGVPKPPPKVSPLLVAPKRLAPSH